MPWWIIQRGVDGTLTIVVIVPRRLISQRFLGWQAMRIRVIIVMTILSGLFFRVNTGKIASLNYGNAFAETLIGIPRNKGSTARSCSTISAAISATNYRFVCVVPHCESNYDCTWKSFFYFSLILFKFLICRHFKIFNLFLTECWIYSDY